jgi:hypothetical protein
VLENAFIGRAEPPTEEDLAVALGPAKDVWDRLLAELADEYELTTREWNSYSPKAGWSLRLKQKKRNIIHLSPCKGGMRAVMILGDRAIAAARESKLSKALLKNIEESKKYPEGTAVRFDPVGAKDIPAIRKLTGIKLEH